MSFTSSSSTIYNNRRDSGLYDATVDQAIALPKGTAMSHATYKTDFTRASQPQSSNFSYKKVGSNVDKEMIVFGQIAPAVLGTKLTAIGDHYIGDDDRPFLIEDKTRVKFVFALCEPSKSPKRMATLFHNQIATLDQLIDTTEEELEGQPKPLSLKKWIGHSGPATNVAPDLIYIKTLPIYVSNKDQKLPSVGKKIKLTKQPIDDLPSARTDEKKKATASKDEDDLMDDVDDYPSSSTASSSANIHGNPELTTDTLYSPTILYDYGGFPFNHVNAKLRQLDLRDTRNNLVPPTDWYTTFRTGAFIMARVTLHGFNVNNRRIYQLNAHTVRLLDASTEPVEERQTRNNAEDTDAGQTDDAASDAFSSFNLGKRSRKDDK